MPTMNKEQVTAAIEDALDQGGHIIIRFGTDRMRTLKAEESVHILAAMKAPLADVPRSSAWVPVTERLPEIDMDKPPYSRGTKVLIHWDGGGVAEAEYTANWYSKQARASKPRFEWQGRIAPWNVTHWMPMPSIPANSARDD